MKKMLITGAGGFLGARLVNYYQCKYEVIGITRKDVDITNSGEMRSLLERSHPDLVLHCAAISDTSFAQNHPQESYKMNVEATLQIARGCKEVGAKLVYMSSDQVYTGNTNSGGLLETEKLSPENVYGKHKLEAENLVREVGIDAVGLRLTWMYDLPTRHMKTNSNLLWNITKAALRNEKISFRTGDYRGITYVWEVVEKMEEIWELPSGIYNCGSENTLTAYETAVFAAQQLGCETVEELIEKDDSILRDEIRNISINTEKLQKQGVMFRNTQEGIKHCLKEYGYII